MDGSSNRDVNGQIGGKNGNIGEPPSKPDNVF